MNSFEDTPLGATQPIGSEAPPEADCAASDVPLTRQEEAGVVREAVATVKATIMGEPSSTGTGDDFMRQPMSIRRATELEARAIYLGLPRDARNVASVARIMIDRHGKNAPSHHTVAWWSKRYHWGSLADTTDSQIARKTADRVAQVVTDKIAPRLIEQRMSAIEMLEEAARAGLAQAAAVAAMSADYKGLVAGAVEALQFANVLKGGVSNRVSVGSGVYNESDASLIGELQRRSVLADANPRPSDHET